MQILQDKNARSDLLLSNADRKQLGIQSEVVRNNDKHTVLPMHDLHVGQQVMYQDSASKCQYLAVIDSLCPEPRSYKISTRKHNLIRSLLHLRTRTCNPISVSSLMAQSYHMWPKKTEHKKSQVNNEVQVQTSRPKRDNKPTVKLDL